MINLFKTSARNWLTATLILSLGFIIGCGPRETQIQKASREGIMIVGNGAEPSDLDPQTITGVPERNITATMFEGLTRSDPETLEARPGVAKNWAISDDGLTYTFHLRAGVTWSDGEPLDANDFYSSFRRMLAPQLGSDNSDQLYDVVNAEEFHKGRIPRDRRSHPRNKTKPSGFLSFENHGVAHLGPCADSRLGKAW